VKTRQPDRARPGGVLLFSEGYYDHVIRTCSYARVDLLRFDFDLDSLGPQELNRRYLCHSRADQFAAIPASRRIATTGFGMSGTPHMATVAQIMKMIRLQKAGERCQIVLGDLDAYSGRALAYQHTVELAERYRSFIQRLGFDDDTGILRNQRDHAETLRAMYMLGRYTTDSDFDGAEEDLHGHYFSLGLVDHSMTFRRCLALSLMAADFIALGQSYEGVLVALGIDEHKYVRFAQDVLTRFDTDTPLRNSFVLAAVYSRMNVGFNGHAKFSKSIPGSAISVDSSADEIAALVLADECRSSLSSPVLQLMLQMSFLSESEQFMLDRDDGVDCREWRRTQQRFVEFLVSVKELWN
jgi:tryptophanyl-tRNA synthetase